MRGGQLPFGLRRHAPLNAGSNCRRCSRETSCHPARMRRRGFDRQAATAWPGTVRNRCPSWMLVSRPDERAHSATLAKSRIAPTNVNLPSSSGAPRCRRPGGGSVNARAVHRSSSWFKSRPGLHALGLVHINQKDRCKVFQGRLRRRLFAVTSSFARVCQPDAQN
jgi:hypothetical protein